MSKPPLLLARYKIYYDIVEVMGCDTNAMQNAEPRSRSNSISWQSRGAEAGSSAEYLSNYQTGMKLSRHCFTLCFPKTDFFPPPWTLFFCASLYSSWPRAEACRSALDDNKYQFSPYFLCNLVDASRVRAHLVPQHSAGHSEAAQFVSAAPWWTYCSSFKRTETGREL